VEVTTYLKTGERWTGGVSETVRADSEVRLLGAPDWRRRRRRRRRKAE
jgi:hypothetical protein